MNSSWIDSILYLPAGSRKGYVAVFFKVQPKVNGVVSSDPRATLYADVPCGIKGLLVSGSSLGKAYHRVLKGKYVSQSVVGEEAVAELRKLMERKMP